jgi:hypothetical protein
MTCVEFFVRLTSSIFHHMYALWPAESSHFVADRIRAKNTRFSGVTLPYVRVSGRVQRHVHVAVTL